MMEDRPEITNFLPCPAENYKENSCESINVENIKDTQYHFSNTINKKVNFNERCLFYKKPIKKDNYRLQIGFDETPQEMRQRELLHRQKQ
jgi:hypothetical protein